MQAVIILLLILGGLVLWQRREAKAPPIIPPTAPSEVATIKTVEQITQAYAEAGYTGKQLTDIVSAVTNYNADIAAIKSNPPEVNTYLAVAGTIEAAALAQAGMAAFDPTVTAPFTSEQIGAYLSEPARDPYGNICTTQEGALEAAQRQLKIAEMQTSPGIRESMLLIAQGMFEQAKNLP